MANNTTSHPICHMCDNAKFLRDKARFAAKAAHDHAGRVNHNAAQIGSLDIEGIFADLHKMVELVGGKSNRAHMRAHKDQGTYMQLAAE